MPLLPRKGITLILLVLTTVIFALTSVGAGETSHIYPFGMCSNGNILSNPEYAEKMEEAGARICRVDVTFGEVRPHVEDDPNKWNWSKMEALSKVRKQHPNLEFLGLLGYGAKWAEDLRFRDVPGSEGAAPQRGVEAMPAWSPENLYGQYVYETVRRYKSVVHIWESWNEPDLPGHAFFKGNGKDFFAYQKACYLAAKKADPGCVVLFAGMCYANVEGYLFTHGLNAPSPSPPQECFFEDYLKACALDPDAPKNHYYFDVMNQHSYGRASDLYDYTLVDRKLMRDALGEEKPVWMTETGFEDKPGLFGGNADEYCDYLLQSFAWGQRAGVQRQFHFQLDNSNGFGLYQGMLGLPKPALVTYRDVLTKEFANARFVSQKHGSAGVGLLEGNTPFKPGWKTVYDLFEFQDGKRRLWIAFTDTTQPVNILVRASRPYATLVDRHNVRTKVYAKSSSRIKFWFLGVE